MAVSIAELWRIHQVECDELRNNEITRCYEHLAEDLGAFTGTPPANWCSAAQWASKTIGIGIRWSSREQPSASHDVDALDGWARGRTSAYLAACRGLQLLPDARRRVGRALADGNRDVFYEIGAGIEQTIERFRRQATIQPGELESFVRTLEPWDPAGSLGDAPVELFREGLSCYVLAHVEADPATRAQLVLAGDLLLAIYEQTRLQPVIEEVFWSAPDEVRSRLAGLPGIRRVGAVRRVLDWCAHRSRHPFALLITNTVLVYATHDGVFSLRRGRLRASDDGARVPELHRALQLARSLEPGHSVRRLPWTDVRRRAISATGIIDSLHQRAPSSPFSERELSMIFASERLPIPA